MPEQNGPTVRWLEILNQSLNLTGFDPREPRRKLVPAIRQLVETPDDARISAVMLLFYPKNEDLYLVFGKRPETLRNHPGQIAFPGGKHEDHETLEDTALRETREELGVPSNRVRVLGRLEPLYIPPSNFLIFPFVGWFPHVPQFVPEPREVSRVIELPVRHFMNEENFTYGPITTGGGGYSFPYYRVGEDQLWGATATVLSEMVARLSAVWPEGMSP